MANRFDGLADQYARFRPDYPAVAIAVIEAACRQAGATGGKLADVGAGTGISSRQIGDALGGSWHVTGFEPSDDMRRTAEELSKSHANVEFASAPAEQLPLSDGSVQAVLAAQAAHWFDRPAFYREAGRVLASQGRLFILFNDRDNDAPLFQEMEALLERAMADYTRNYRSHDYPTELAGLGWNGEVSAQAFEWTWRLTPADFAGLMLSRSLARPWREQIGDAAARARLMDLADGYLGPDDLVALPYVTRLTQTSKS